MKFLSSTLLLSTFRSNNHFLQDILSRNWFLISGDLYNRDSSSDSSSDSRNLSVLECSGVKGEKVDDGMVTETVEG